MKILNQFPPNYDEIARRFNLKGAKPIFTFGDIIYNPHDGEITEDLIAHEEVHCKQHESYGIDAWWTRYLDDAEFRLSQEVPAYQAQYKKLLTMPRDYRRARTKMIVADLSGPMYGNLITKEQALKLITQNG